MKRCRRVQPQNKVELKVVMKWCSSLADAVHAYWIPMFLLLRLVDLHHTIALAIVLKFGCRGTGIPTVLL